MINNNLLKIKVQLNWMRPSNYRTFLLWEEETFHDLHLYIQNHFWFDGWHLWVFETHLGEIWYEWKKPKNVKLKSIFTEKWVKISYTYDFWDNWQFSITCQWIIENDWNIKFPDLIKTQWWELLEDCWGVWWLEEYLEDYKNKTFNDEDFEDFEDFEYYMKPCFEEVRFFDHNDKRNFL